MKLKVYSEDGGESQQVDCQVPTFEENQATQTLKDVLVAYQANRRLGTASAKTRAEVKGTGKKAFRQKGTGRARRGDLKSPIIRGGGVAHGPRPRDWSHRINKKIKRLALSRALFDKVNEGTLCLIEKFEMPEPKTKLMDALLNKLVPSGKILLVDQAFDKAVSLSARNIQRAYFAEVSSLNAWDLVRFKHTLISRAAFASLLKRLEP